MSSETSNLDTGESATMGGSIIPDHVPECLSYTLTPQDLSLTDADPFVPLQQVRKLPKIFYNSYPGFFGCGFWMVTTSDLMGEVLRNPELFSSQTIADFSKLLGEDWPLVPLELDPPRQTEFRRALAPVLSPSVVKGMEDDIRVLANELLDRLGDARECDFMTAYGTPLPVTIFMRLMGMPMEELQTFLDWEYRLLHEEDIGLRVEAAACVKIFLEELIEKRRREPSTDLVSFCLAMDVNGKPVSNDEILGVCFLLFVAGLDTVASSMGYIFQYLATHEEERRRLTADESLIPAAVEELLRRYSIVVTRRKVMRDMDFHGVALKEGDYIMCDLSLANTDPEKWDCPMDLDLERQLNPHVAFGLGPHRCLGSNLARAEMHIGIAEWLKRIPDFKVKKGAEVTSRTNLKGLNSLPLVW